ncbi:MAG: hypothetical protein Q8M15_02195 [Bacteroidota bacterium]|nr:hypothetical protein [Bacteroidota bacterium]
MKNQYAFFIILFIVVVSCKKATNNNTPSTPIKTKIVTINCTLPASIDSVNIALPYAANLVEGKTYKIKVWGSTNMPIFLKVNVEGVQVCSMTQSNGYLGINYDLKIN